MESVDLAQRADLVKCSPGDPGWLQLARQSDQATAFHLPEWSEAVSQTYGFPSFVLAMRGVDGGFLAGLPVMEVRDIVGRRRLVSLPFTDHCPPLHAANVDPADFARSLVHWQAAGGVPGLEVRAALPSVEGALTQTVGTRHLVHLGPDSEALFRGLHRNRIQKRVRRAREYGVEVTLSRSPADLETFYRLHCQTRHRQGVPVQPLRFIRNIWEKVIQAGHGFVILATVQERPVATALFLVWNHHLIYKYGASDSAYWKLGVNFLVHWTAMEWGCVNGYRTYDFGRTDAGHESLREFKAAWGSDEVELSHTYVGAAGEASGRGRAAEILKQVIRHSPAVVGRAVGEVLYRYAA
jgi:CelD/BcsL family acetyltransferase involved in cellulose biosynthesis